ncbi:MAG: DNA cytosine methyltransferase [Lachnospiraceae bacterium]|nr:DNA cytosine methyltransferase [Lachnospiraceae bacterium]
MMMMKLGELFCGPGGFACGALRSSSADGSLGLIHAWANDYDPDTCKTYITNICPKELDSVHCGENGWRSRNSTDGIRTNWKNIF